MDEWAKATGMPSSRQDGEDPPLDHSQRPQSSSRPLRGCDNRVVDEEQLRKATVGELKPFNGRIQLADYDPNWPDLFERAAARIRSVLGDRVVQLEHGWCGLALRVKLKELSR